MIEKAYIENIINKYSYKIRMPKYNSMKLSNTYTQSQNLYEAYVCAQPGGEPKYVVGDLVWVAFESEYVSNPIILGRVYNENISQSRTYLNENTDFYFDIKELNRRLANIQSQISNCLNIHLKQDVDIDKTFLPGIYICNKSGDGTGSTGSPDPQKVGGVLIVFPYIPQEYEENRTQGNCAQLFFSINETDKVESISNNIYYRGSTRTTKETTTATWGNWVLLSPSP